MYFETFEEITEAISREKQLKGWRRSRKVALINAKNPDWKDLFEWLDEHVEQRLLPDEEELSKQSAGSPKEK